MILKVQTGDIIGLFSNEMLIRLENGVIIQFQILYDPISRKVTSTQLSNEHIFGLEYIAVDRILETEVYLQ